MEQHLAYFLGVLCGDGYISSKGQIEIKSKSIGFSIILSDITEKLFGIRLKIRAEKYKNFSYYRAYLFSSKVTEILFEFGLKSPKTFNIRVPEQIKNTDIHKKAKFLQGVYDTDGSFYTKINKNIINYQTISLESRSEFFINDVLVLLKEMGLNPRMIIYSKRNKPAYLVRLYGFKEFYKYMRTISFSNPEKLKKANKTLMDGIIRMGR